MRRGKVDNKEGDGWSRRKEGGGGGRAGLERVSKDGESGERRLLITAPERALSEFPSPPCSLSGGGIKGEDSQSQSGFSLAPPPPRLATRTKGGFNSCKSGERGLGELGGQVAVTWLRGR